MKWIVIAAVALVVLWVVAMGLAAGRPVPKPKNNIKEDLIHD